MWVNYIFLRKKNIFSIKFRKNSWNWNSLHCALLLGTCCRRRRPHSGLTNEMICIFSTWNIIILVWNSVGSVSYQLNLSTQNFVRKVWCLVFPDLYLVLSYFWLNRFKSSTCTNPSLKDFQIRPFKFEAVWNYLPTNFYLGLIQHYWTLKQYYQQWNFYVISSCFPSEQILNYNMTIFSRSYLFYFCMPKIFNYWFGTLAIIFQEIQ